MKPKFRHSFVRPDAKVLHSEHEATVVSDSMPTDIRHFFELVANCFQGHVEPHLSAQGHRLLPTKDEAKKRGVQNDLLTAYFQLNVYAPADLSMTKSLASIDLARLASDYDEFFSNTVGSPVSDDFCITGNPGTNRLNFLAGTIGCGKSLLLAKLATDVHRKAASLLEADGDTRPANQAEDDAVIPVFVDFELLFEKNGDVFPPIDQRFLAIVLDAIERELARYPNLRCYLTENIPDQNLPIVTRIRDLCIQLLRHKSRRVRLLLILDNVDRYHFYYSKWAFFERYRSAQIASIRNNLDQILTHLCESDFLGDCALCVILACRPETLHTFTHHSSALHVNVARLRDLGVFQLARRDHWPLIESRLDLIEAATACFRESKPQTFAEYMQYLELMRKTLGRSCAEDEPSRWRNSLQLIADFAHQGPRSFLMFLADLKIDWRNQSTIVERIFGRDALNGRADPHNLLRLYITNNRQRYAQASRHFPNLFLVDATYARDESFPEADVTHGHTYWLKYLLLKYVCFKASTTDTVVSLNEILDVFASSYPEKLVRLVLGSLASSETSGCIEVADSLDHRVVRVRPTLRGQRIIGDTGEQCEWCFSWDYLQFVVDDYQLAYPVFLWDKIYVREGGSLGYLLRPSGPYAAEMARQYIAKAKACIYFLRVLHEAQKAEKRNRLKENSELLSLMPNFDQLYRHFQSELARISEHVRNGSELLQEVEALRAELVLNEEIRNFFLVYGDDEHFVVEPA